MCHFFLYLFVFFISHFSNRSIGASLIYICFIFPKKCTMVSNNFSLFVNLCSIIMISQTSYLIFCFSSICNNYAQLVHQIINTSLSRINTRLRFIERIWEKNSFGKLHTTSTNRIVRILFNRSLEQHFCNEHTELEIY